MRFEFNKVRIYSQTIGDDPVSLGLQTNSFTDNGYPSWNRYQKSICERAYNKYKSEHEYTADALSEIKRGIENLSLEELSTLDRRWGETFVEAKRNPDLTSQRPGGPPPYGQSSSSSDDVQCQVSEMDPLLKPFQEQHNRVPLRRELDELIAKLHKSDKSSDVAMGGAMEGTCQPKSPPKKADTPARVEQILIAISDIDLKIRNSAGAPCDMLRVRHRFTKEECDHVRRNGLDANTYDTARDWPGMTKAGFDHVFDDCQAKVINCGNVELDLRRFVYDPKTDLPACRSVLAAREGPDASIVSSVNPTRNANHILRSNTALEFPDNDAYNRLDGDHIRLVDPLLLGTSRFFGHRTDRTTGHPDYTADKDTVWLSKFLCRIIRHYLPGPNGGRVGRGEDKIKTADFFLRRDGWASLTRLAELAQAEYNRYAWRPWSLPETVARIEDVVCAYGITKQRLVLGETFGHVSQIRANQGHSLGGYIKAHELLTPMDYSYMMSTGVVTLTHVCDMDVWYKIVKDGKINAGGERGGRDFVHSATGSLWDEHTGTGFRLANLDQKVAICFSLIELVHAQQYAAAGEINAFLSSTGIGCTSDIPSRYWLYAYSIEDGRKLAAYRSSERMKVIRPHLQQAQGKPSPLHDALLFQGIVLNEDVANRYIGLFPYGRKQAQTYGARNVTEYTILWERLYELHVSRNYFPDGVPPSMDDRRDEIVRWTDETLELIDPPRFPSTFEQQAMFNQHETSDVRCEGCKGKVFLEQMECHRCRIAAPNPTAKRYEASLTAGHVYENHPHLTFKFLRSLDSGEIDEREVSARHIRAAADFTAGRTILPRRSGEPSGMSFADILNELFLRDQPTDLAARWNFIKNTMTRVKKGLNGQPTTKALGGTERLIVRSWQEAWDADVGVQARATQFGYDRDSFHTETLPHAPMYIK